MTIQARTYLNANVSSCARVANVSEINTILNNTLSFFSERNPESLEDKLRGD